MPYRFFFVSPRLILFFGTVTAHSLSPFVLCGFLAFRVGTNLYHTQYLIRAGNARTFLYLAGYVFVPKDVGACYCVPTLGEVRWRASRKRRRICGFALSRRCWRDWKRPAKTSGRTLTGEIVHRIEQTFRKEEDADLGRALLGGDDTAKTLQLIANAMRLETAAGTPWSKDQEKAEAVRTAAHLIIAGTSGLPMMQGL